MGLLYLAPDCHKGRMKKILIIDDDVTALDIVDFLFEDRGYEVVRRADGLSALECVESVKPDIILIDLMMPIMDGYTFRTEQMKNPEWSKVPVVVMSAEANAKEKMKNFGITAFLSKPVELDTILKTVERFS